MMLVEITVWQNKVWRVCGTCEDDRNMVNRQLATQQDSKPAWTDISAGSNIHQNVKKKSIYGVTAMGRCSDLLLKASEASNCQRCLTMINRQMMVVLVAAKFFRGHPAPRLLISVHMSRLPKIWNNLVSWLRSAKTYYIDVLLPWGT